MLLNFRKNFQANFRKFIDHLFIQKFNKSKCDSFQNLISKILLELLASFLNVLNFLINFL